MYGMCFRHALHVPCVWKITLYYSAWERAWHLQKSWCLYTTQYQNSWFFQTFKSCSPLLESQWLIYLIVCIIIHTIHFIQIINITKDLIITMNSKFQQDEYHTAGWVVIITSINTQMLWQFPNLKFQLKFKLNNLSQLSMLSSLGDSKVTHHILITRTHGFVRQNVQEIGASQLC